MQIIDNQSLLNHGLVTAKRSSTDTRLILSFHHWIKGRFWWPYVSVISILFWSNSGVKAQTNDDVFEEIMQSISIIIEDFVENSEGNADLDFNTISEDLYFIYQNPLNINEASNEDLAELLFLNELEISGIISYRNSYGNFLSPYEIQVVPSLTRSKARLLLPFVTVGEDVFAKPLVNIKGLGSNKNELFVKWKRVFEERKGFKSNGIDPPKYAGSENYMYTRFVHVNENNWKAGFTIEKDDGEKWTNPNSTLGLDYLSAYFEKKHLSKLISQINIGDYNVNLGQGLISHTSFGLGKSSFTTQVLKAGRKLKNYNSVVENRPLRGAAVLLSPSKHIEALVFSSYETRDANLLATDSNGFINISSLQTSGYHRTDGEIEDQDALQEFAFGGNVTWKNQEWSVGLNTIHHHFDKELIRASTPYRLFQWRGNQLSNYSLDYRTVVKGYTLFGEIAYSNNGGWANIHGLIKGLDPKLDVSVIYRNYNPGYQSLYANAFGESNLANNERGIYFGMRYRPTQKIGIRAYADFWNNPWLRSRSDGLNDGKEYLLRLDYTPERHKNIYISYRYEQKQENTSDATRIDLPIARQIQRLRIHASFRVHENLTLRSRIEGTLFDKGNESEKGILAYQDLIFKSLKSPLSGTARYSYFNISDFDARIYAYESDLLYEYYIPSFNGEGMRYYLKLRYNISSRIMVEARVEQTRFFNQETISSGNNQIEGNHFTRIKAQMRFRF